MTSAPARSAFFHRAKVERNVATGEDHLGQPFPPNFTTLATVVALAWAKGITTVIDGDKLVVIPTVFLLVRSAEDIIEADQIAEVTDRADAVIFSGPLRIMSIETHLSGYKRITLQKETGA